MKIIVASFAKCGTKTLHACLEQLGYSVYDFDTNFVHLGSDWYNIMKYGSNQQQLKRMYENIDAVCDLPACYFWEDIYKAFPESKIILTTRDSEEEWVNSWDKQIGAIESDKTFALAGNLTWTGRKFFKYYRLMGRVIFGCPPQSPFTYFRQPNTDLKKRRYRDHVNSVLLRAPKDRLLVFKLSDGWRPICDFLGKPVPETPFPRENVGGVAIKDMMSSNPLFVKLGKELSVTLFLLTVIFAVALFYLISLAS